LAPIDAMNVVPSVCTTVVPKNERTVLPAGDQRVHKAAFVRCSSWLITLRAKHGQLLPRSLPALPVRKTDGPLDTRIGTRRYRRQPIQVCGRRGLSQSRLEPL
jgi:hypothetical protein